MTSDKNGLKNELRKKIYQFILEYPGLHKCELSRRLNIPKTTLNHHLKYLEKHGHIVVSSEDRCTRFYDVNNIGMVERKVIHVLRRETSRNIILYLGWAHCASQVELSRELDLSPKTIERHLKRLIDIGIVEPTPVENGIAHTAHIKAKIVERDQVGREIVYRLAKVPNKDMYMGGLVGELFSNYQKGLVDDEDTKLILELFRNARAIYKTRKRFKKIRNFVDPIEKGLYEIFPHPYHV